MHFSDWRTSSLSASPTPQGEFLRPWLPAPLSHHWRIMRRGLAAERESAEETMQTGPRLCGRLLPLRASVLLLLAGCSGFSSHCRHFRHVIWDSGQGLPTYLAMAYMDDQLWGSYNSSTRQVFPRAAWIKNAEEDNPSFWDWYTESALSKERKFEVGLRLLRKHYNQSEGVLILQQWNGCDLWEDGSKRGFSRYGYNGRDFLTLDFETLTWTAADVDAQAIKREWDAKLAYSNKANIVKLKEECIQQLQKFLEYGKEALLRKEPPIMTVSHKVSYDGQETLTCRAHGFYPKEINATWRKDGKLWEQETFRGGVVPNSDGTYHTWISTKIDPKDRVHYWCHVEHAGLMEPLEMSWQKSSSVGHLVGVTFGLMSAVLMVVGIMF